MFIVILKSIMAQIGWSKLVKTVWELADDPIKKQVIESENKVDDLAFKVVDSVVKEL